nr:nonstructural polyprotein [Hepelivirales sp.]
MFNPHGISNTQTGDVATRLAAVTLDGINHVIGNAWEIPYVLTEQQFNIVASLFKPRLVKYAKTLRTHVHPIAAITTIYAYDIISKDAMFAGPGVIDIGGTPLRTNPKHHICTLVNDIRTEQRYVEASAMRPNSIGSYHLHHDSIKLCSGGAQKCSYPAKFAYSVHVYDIPFSDIPTIFNKHNLVIYDAWMLLPYMLIEPSRDKDQTYYKVRKSWKKDTVYVTYGDNSNSYIHSYSNWRKYALINYIKCLDHTIVIERKESLGTFTRIRFTKVKSTIGSIEYVFHMPEYDETYDVPDVATWFLGTNASEDFFHFYFNVDKTFVNKALDFGERSKEGVWSYDAFISYLHSIEHNVWYTVSGSLQLVYKGLDVEAMKKSNLYFSLFMIISVRRYRRTKGIGSAIKFLQSHEPGVWTSIKDYLRINWERCKHHIKADFKNMDYDTYLELRMQRHNVRKGWTNVENIYDLDVRTVPVTRISNYMKIDLDNKKKYTRNLYYNNYGPTVREPEPPELILEDYSEDNKEEQPVLIEDEEDIPSEEEQDTTLEEENESDQESNYSSTTSHSDLDVHPKYELVEIDDNDSKKLEMEVDKIPLPSHVVEDIRKDRKVIEVRRAQGRYPQMKQGDLITFVDNKDPNSSVVRQIEKIEEYENLDHLLATEKYKEIDPDSKDVYECKKIYEKRGYDVLDGAKLLAIRFKHADRIKQYYDKVIKFVTNSKTEEPVDCNVNTDVMDIIPYEKELENFKVNSMDTVLNPHYKIIHDPSGTNGECGINAYKYIMPNLIVPEKHIWKGMTHTLRKNFLDAMDMMCIAEANNMRMILHTFVNGKLHIEKHGVGRPARLLLVNGHYHVIDCDCDKEYVVGDYANLKIDKNNLYVNCANYMCADGGGQAYAFRKMFPGYDKNLKKPVGITNFLVHKNVHLAICVAHDMSRDNDMVKVYHHFGEIFGEIEKYCIKNDLTVIMPMIGTSIYANPMCCFKKFYEQLRCKKILSCFNENEWQRFKACVCTHGGMYKAFSRGVKLERKYDPDKWLEIAANKPDQGTHMARKFENYVEVCTHLKDQFKFNEPAMNDDLSIMELSASPGYFVKAAEKYPNITYYAGHYAGPGNDCKPNFKPSFVWKNTQSLNVWTVPKNSHVLLDYPINFIPSKDLQTIMTFFLNNNATEKSVNNPTYPTTFTTKYVYDEETMEHVVAFINSQMQSCIGLVWRNQGSNANSSEVYVTFIPKDPGAKTPEEDALDLNVVQMEVDEEALKKQEEHVCTCGPIDDYFDSKFSFEIEPSCLDTFLNEVLHDESVIKKNLQAVTTKISKLKVVRKRISIDAKFGVAGSAKTREILKRTCSKCTYYVAPLRKLVEDQGSTHYKAVVHMSMHASVKNVVVDECCLIHPYMFVIYKHLWPEAKIFGIGDPCQIRTIDFSKDVPKLDIKFGEYLLKSKRITQVAANMLSIAIPGIKSVSGVLGKLAHRPVKELFDVVLGKNDAVLCHTQDVKASLKEKFGKQVYTTTEAMGSTFNNVHIVTTDLNLLVSEKERHVYVALSRATGNIVSYGNDAEKKEYYALLNSTIERALEQTGVIPHEDVIHSTSIEAKPYPSQKTVNRNIKVKADDVADILRKYVTPMNDSHPRTVAYQMSIIEENCDKKMLVFSDNMLTGEDTTVKASVVYQHTQFNSQWHPKNAMQCINTLTKRYTKKTIAPNEQMYLEHVRGLEQFMVPDYKEQLRKNPITSEEAYTATLDYLVKLQKKFPQSLLDEMEEGTMAEYNFEDMHLNPGAPSKDNITTYIDKMAKAVLSGKEQKIVDLEMEWYDNYTFIVQFHLKRQPKCIPKHGFGEEWKAGQGVSAWSKLLNVMMAAMADLSEKRFMQVLKKEVLVCYGLSDAEIGDRFNQVAPLFFDRNLKITNTDIGEFDSSQNKSGVKANVDISRLCGIPTTVINLYEAQRTKRMLRLFGDSPAGRQVLKLLVLAKQDSGQKMTLFHNSSYTLSIMGSSFDFKNIKFVGVKGDDFICVSESAEVRFIGKERSIDKHGYKIKMLDGKMNEFIANIITPQGFFPDLIRRTTRIMSRLITHPDDWDEIKRNADDSLSVIRDYGVGLDCAEMYYNERGIYISKQELEMLYHFLYQVTWDKELLPTKIEDFIFRTIDPSQAKKYLVDRGIGLSDAKEHGKRRVPWF